MSALAFDRREVRIVVDERGSHVDPPLNPGWPLLDQLAWHAAVVSVRTGLDISVGRAVVRWDGAPLTERFSVVVGHSSIGPFDFPAAWTLLSGVEVGGREVTASAAAGSPTSGSDRRDGGPR